MGVQVHAEEVGCLVALIKQFGHQVKSRIAFPLPEAHDDP